MTEEKETVLKSIELNSTKNQRLLIYITKDLLGKGFVCESLITFNKVREGASTLFVYKKKETEEGKLLGEEVKCVEREEIHYQDSSRVLGKTYDALVLDVIHDLRPDDIGKLVEVVRGGGIIIMVGPRVEEVDNWVTNYQREIVVEPFQGEMKARFEKRFLNRTIGRDGIIYVSRDKVVAGKVSNELGKAGVSEPFGSFPRELYEMCLTNEQVKVLKECEGLKGKGKYVLLVRANRGRGKSAILGICASALIYSSREFREIVVTSPYPDNVQTLFEFAVKGLESLGQKVKLKEKEGYIVEVWSRKGKVFYLSPLSALKSKANIAIVDEASGIPIPILLSIMRSFWRVVFSSTTHGYEGSGRAFAIRFMKRLEKERGEELKVVEMETPIRYGANDPIEKWLYDVLLLDAEPQEVKEIKEVSYLKVDRDSLFSTQEDLLRQLVGLYVLTHYRNRPNDLVLMGDAPHHFLRALITDSKVVSALHLAYEGGLKEELIKEAEKIRKGHLIPVLVLRYYPQYKAFAKMKGVRVVRIAVHPEHWNKGIGSLALTKLEEELRGEVDWIGSGFGSTPELLRFWLRNGFIPIGLGGKPNEVSGEFTVVVVKPLSKRAEDIVSEVSREFRIRFLDSLFDTYYNMDSYLAQVLLSRSPGEYKAKPEFHGSQGLRLESYLNKYITYEGASDSIRALTKAHFLSGEGKRLSLTQEEERLLILKVLQGKPWRIVGKILHRKVANLREELMEVVKRMHEYY
jgi:tRNA(Met) cytidine acetyltransferase